MVMLAETVSKWNVFEFGADHYVQVSGTAVETKIAPSYANIHGSTKSKNTGRSCTEFHGISEMHRWLIIWRDGEAELPELSVSKKLRFFETLNAFHPSIQFTYEYSKTSVNFLNVTVNLGKGGRLWTDLYTKPTDTHQYLLTSSCHVKKSRGNSQTIGIRNVCSNDVTARKCRWADREPAQHGHSRRKMRREVKRAFDIPLPEIVAGEKKARNTTRISLVTTYHSGLPDIQVSYVDTRVYFNKL